MNPAHIERVCHQMWLGEIEFITRNNQLVIIGNISELPGYYQSVIDSHGVDMLQSEMVSVDVIPLRLHEYSLVVIKVLKPHIGVSPIERYSDPIYRDRVFYPILLYQAARKIPTGAPDT
jgi:hypothetical protein